MTVVEVISMFILFEVVTISLNLNIFNLDKVIRDEIVDCRSIVGTLEADLIVISVGNVEKNDYVVNIIVVVAVNVNEIEHLSCFVLLGIILDVRLILDVFIDFIAYSM